MDIVETCMSTNIKNHYDLAKEDLGGEIGEDILNDYVIDFIKVYEKLQDELEMTDDDKSSEWFKDATKILIPCLHRIHKLFGEIKGDFGQLCDFLDWTSQPSHFAKCWEMLKQNDEGEHTTECLLLLTPILERSLGDLLISVDKNVKVPALLRDLLKRQELFELLGTPCMTFLRIIFGSPHSLNLRNIVWHGFGFPGEISNIFASVTFLIFTSIGNILKQKTLKLSKRKMLSISRIKKIDDQNVGKYLKNINLEELARNSKLFYSRNLKNLNKILSYFKSEEFALCSVMLLPLLEVTFRKLFVIENDCPERMLTAEAESLYTTYNEIFEEFLENSEKNKIQDVLGEDLMLLMYDLLTLPDGPRVRDKLSHGEVLFSLSSSPEEKSQGEMKTLASHLLVILVILLSKKSVNLTVSKDLDEILKNYQNYKTLFHPSTLLVNSLLENLVKLEEICSVKPPTDFEFEIVSFDPFSQNGCLPDQIYMESMLLDHDGQNNLSRKEFLHNISSTLQSYRGSSLYRPRQEYEVITVLQKISDQVSLSCERVLESLKEKLELFETKEMRSRQRVTYRRMLETVPKVQNQFFHIICFTFHILVKKDNISLLDPGKLNSFVKYLKKILKICENICTNVHLQKNKWEEVEKLSTQLKSLISEYQIQF
eukprot:GFUD01001149.1.p1 GENE.GFUD01001149.1~~GFUD01001149.1.p1  ORF type:complete len:655 (-),score=153.21 GFUD01001149.1:11-1975(-)